MKLAELSAELSDPTPEQNDYDVVVADPDDRADNYEVSGVRWDHENKLVVITY